MVAAKMLQARHGAERLQNCWHGGLQTLDSLKSSVQVKTPAVANGFYEGPALVVLNGYYEKQFALQSLQIAQ